MKTRTIKLYSGAVNASTNAAAVITLPRSCTVVAVNWNVTITTGAATGYFRIELSRQNTAQAVNDVSNIVSQVTCGGTLNTNGIFQGVNFCDLGMAETLQAGDKLNLNATLGGTQTVLIECLIRVVE